MQNESAIDPDQLQRLIDGELSANEVRDLLERADQDPSQWRTIGCAFAEDQLFQKQFETLTGVLTETPAKDFAPNPASASVAVSQNGSTGLIQKLAIAASFAVAGLIGYLMGSDSRMPATDLPANSNMIAHDDSANQTLTPVDLQPEYRMELLTPDGEAIDGEVDLYRYNDLHRLVGNGDSRRRVTLNDVLPPSGFTAEARKRLSRSGYEINESTDYMSGRLQDGRQFVVPVRSIRFDQGH
jgi:hypothetical protein